MLIAHLPAGYLGTRFLLDRAKAQVSAVDYQRYLRVGMIASILPDCDVTYYYLYHYLYGQWGPKHHTYWSHTPFYWLIILMTLFLCSLLSRKRKLMFATYIGGANLLLHFVLDSFASKIKWLYPLSNKAFGLFEMTPRYYWWPWNFVFHWTFCFELILVMAAIYVVMKDTRIPVSGNTRNISDMVNEAEEE
jgi:hypothetical protein